MMIFLPLDPTKDNEYFNHQGEKWEVALRAVIFHAPKQESTEVVAMTSRTIWRVWYGKRLGIPQSFEDIGNFDSAANFAASIEADRIEVVRELIALPSAKIAA